MSDLRRVFLAHENSLFSRLVHNHLFAGLLLIGSTAVALWLANSAHAEWYFHFRHTPVSINVGAFAMQKSLEHWVNDALMSFFFFYIGLEIKKEVIDGELSSMRRAALSIVGAIGGMAAPALIYALLTRGSPDVQGGWGIPIATDIAFAIGILSLLGRSVPLSLRVFITALAIVDDLGSILVIALFYSEGVVLSYIGVSLVFVLLARAYNRLSGTALGDRDWVVLMLGAASWYFMFKSGIHATISGVIMALTIPLRERLHPRAVQDYIAEDGFELQHNLPAAERAVRLARSPLRRIIHMLHAPVVMFIMPFFAFMNAGVVLPDSFTKALHAPHMLGIEAGLLFGKCLGITVACWLAVRLRIADLPRGANWTDMVGVGLLAGIGFTMSLFVAGLSFHGDAALLDDAKLAILLASFAAAILGSAVILLNRNRPHAPADDPPPAGGH